ncbi:MAG: glycerophosphodiester phosphodiesterase [Promethearchaeota archaeon]
MSKTFIWGHRGSGFTGVQNTLSSFRNAIDMGVDGIKTEAKLSKDGEVVLCFYQSLRKNGVDVLINNLEMNEIKEYKIENNESIPTLREVFNAFKNFKIKYNFDISEPEVGIKIIELAREFDNVDNIEIAKSSINPNLLPEIFSKVREFDKKITLVNSIFLKHSPIKEKHLELESMRKLNVQVINVNFNYADYKLFKKVKDHGFKFYIWGLLFKRSMDKFLNMKYKEQYIDAMMSNLPDRLIRMRDQIQNLDNA